MRRPRLSAETGWDPRDGTGAALIPLPTPEWKRPSLASVYALTRYVQEQLTLTLSAAYGMEGVALRLFNVYGPGQALSNPYTGVLAIFASRLLNGQRPLVFEDGHQRRDFVHVDDVARAFALALEEPAAAGQVFNSHRLAGDGHDVLVFDSLARPGVEANLGWLTTTHGAKIHHVKADIRDADAVEETVRDASAVFHFAAQVAVTTSLADPRADFEANLDGTFTLLEALRRRGGRVPLVFASTDKVYGDLSDVALEWRAHPPPQCARDGERACMSAADDIRRAAEGLGQWFHNIDLHGVKTAPQHFLGDYPAQKWRRFADAIPADLSGRSVLDIGCNGGFYSIEMKRRGAERVLGLDWDEAYLAQARFAAKVLDLDIEYRKLSVYDVGRLNERFDLVLFMGVLYHLRHPLLALDLIREHVAVDAMVFQSMQRGSREVLPLEPDYPFSETAIIHETGYPKLHFIEKRYANDATNWWVPNRACTEAMLRSAGFAIESHPETEVYVCRVAERPSGAEPVYPARGDSPS